MGGSVQERAYQLLWKVGHAVRLMVLSGGMVEVRAVKLTNYNIANSIETSNKWIIRA
jgi:hypothetical protein